MELFTRIFLAFMWLLHWLPLPLQAAFGWALGHVLYVLVVPRRRVVMINLGLCFPELSLGERRRLARQNFVAVTRSMLERGVIWWASEARIRRLVELPGVEKVHAAHAAGQGVVMLVPHFVGLDMAGARMAMELDCVSMYAAQLNKVLEKMLLHGRTRFRSQILLSRQEGIRGAVRAIKQGRPFYYLPDLDYGPKESIFAPFFGVQTATIPGLPRIARLGNAVVIPLVVRMKPWGRGYVGEFGELWTDFPGESVEADTARMNAWIESEVRKIPAQYYWVHKRFKTRPPGEPRLY
ncbi:lipid A biosynthesis acyltransferase [Uliginosibacterium sp. H3]|uniref:Lipid A biosynthesis acyltransferase n=1 Tax=Uliginosibacterium silvisoli TaxID=3114758 RepID=A0ABU6JZ58_9RHOO|nr:lipid A biosynthesis acyltransferase [Uliginosibacterium sp. H3]